MKFVVFGLTISTSWGNGHATLWRGLSRALLQRGHAFTFFERDTPYYAPHRDLFALPGGELIIYPDWPSIRPVAAKQLAEADAAIVTSYCPDAVAVAELLLESRARLRVFYDLDTPITLGELSRGRPVPYVPARGLRDFDLVLSYTGGAALAALQERLGARRVAPLYGSVDALVHRPVPPAAQYQSALSYLGTYAEDRQAALEELFIGPARLLPQRRFLIGGAQYPATFPWRSNIFFVRHLPPSEHAAFFCSSRLTLNVTRRAMAQMGYCPSGRLFEAAACGTPLLSDSWDGLDAFFEPGTEILVARTAEEAVAALGLSDAELTRIARAARERTLAEYTAEKRAAELESLVSAAPQPAAGALAETAANEG